MIAYLADYAFGVFAFDDEGNLIAYSLNPKDPAKLAEIIIKMEEGELTDAHVKVLEELKKKGYTTIVVEDETLAKNLASVGLSGKVEVRHVGAERIRKNLMDILVELGYVKDASEAYELLHKAGVEATKKKIKEAAEKRDMLAAQGIRAIDDIDKVINLFAARIREWYGLHFPELDNLLKEHFDYIRVVYELGLRDNMRVEELRELGFSQGKAERIAEAARKSMGASIAEFDIKPIRLLAKITLDLYKLRDDIAEYIRVIMKEVAPNITALVGALLGARLISLAGGLDNLAKLPASTIQVLGAEKALFRALRTGGRPPKHGIIFQFPEIHRAPRWQRGKIARALAGKLAIAARVDAFTGQYIGDELKETLIKRIEEIKQVYAKPPKRKEVVKPRKRREKRRRRRKK